MPYPKIILLLIFVGRNNFFKGKVVDGLGTGNTSAVEIAQGRLDCFLPEGFNKDDKVTLAIRPECINLFKQKPSSEVNLLEGKVQDVLFLGDCLDCQILVGDSLLIVKSIYSLDISEGEAIFVQLPAESLRVIH